MSRDDSSSAVNDAVHVIDHFSHTSTTFFEKYLFGLYFFSQIKISSSVAIISMLLHFLQLLAFVFSDTGVWASTDIPRTLDTLRDFRLFFPLADTSFRTYFAVFVLLSLLALGIIIFSGYLAMKWRDEAFPTPSALTCLRWGTMILGRFLFVSTLGLSLSMLDCTSSAMSLFPDRQCWGSTHIVLSVFAVASAVCVILVAMKSVLVHVSATAVSPNLFAGARVTPHLLQVGCETLLTVGAIALHSDSIAWFLLQFVCFGLMFRTSVWHLVYYKPWVNKLQSGFHAILFQASSVALVGKIIALGWEADEVLTSETKSTLTIMVLALMPFSFLLGCGGAHLRLRLLDGTRSFRRVSQVDGSIEKNAEFPLASVEETEIAIRFIYSVPSPSSEKIELAESILYAGRSQYPKSVWLQVLYCSFLSEVQHNFGRADILIRESRGRPSSLMSRYFLALRDRFNKERSLQSADPDSLEDVVAMSSLFVKTSALLQKFEHCQRSFYKALASRHVQPRILQKVVHTAYDVRQDLSGAMTRLLKTNGKSVSVLRLYGRYLSVVKKELGTGAAFFAEASNMEAENHEKRRLDTLFNPDLSGMDDEVDRVITINRIGTMVRVTMRAARMFGYQTAEELLGQNCSILASPPHGVNHDGYLKKSQSISNHGSQLNRERFVLAQHVKGHTFPIRFFIFQVSGGSVNGEAYVARMDPFSKNDILPDELLNLPPTFATDADGKIISFNDKFLEKMRCTSADIFHADFFTIVRNCDGATSVYDLPTVLDTEISFRGVSLPAVTLNLKLIGNQKNRMLLCTLDLDSPTLVIATNRRTPELMRPEASVASPRLNIFAHDFPSRSPRSPGATRRLTRETSVTFNEHTSSPSSSDSSDGEEDYDFPNTIDALVSPPSVSGPTDTELNSRDSLRGGGGSGATPRKVNFNSKTKLPSQPSPARRRSVSKQAPKMAVRIPGDNESESADGDGLSQGTSQEDGDISDEFRVFLQLDSILQAFSADKMPQLLGRSFRWIRLCLVASLVIHYCVFGGLWAQLQIRFEFVDPWTNTVGVSLPSPEAYLVVNMAELTKHIQFVIFFARIARSGSPQYFDGDAFFEAQDNAAQSRFHANNIQPLSAGNQLMNTMIKVRDVAADGSIETRTVTAWNAIQEFISCTMTLTNDTVIAVPAPREWTFIMLNGPIAIFETLRDLIDEYDDKTTTSWNMILGLISIALIVECFILVGMVFWGMGTISVTVKSFRSMMMRVFLSIPRSTAKGLSKQTEVLTDWRGEAGNNAANRVSHRRGHGTSTGIASARGPDKTFDADFADSADNSDSSSAGGEDVSPTVVDETEKQLRQRRGPLKRSNSVHPEPAATVVAMPAGKQSSSPGKPAHPAVLLRSRAWLLLKKSGRSVLSIFSAVVSAFLGRSTSWDKDSEIEFKRGRETCRFRIEFEQRRFIVLSTFCLILWVIGTYAIFLQTVTTNKNAGAVLASAFDIRFTDNHLRFVLHEMSGGWTLFSNLPTMQRNSITKIEKAMDRMLSLDLSNSILIPTLFQEECFQEDPCEGLAISKGLFGYQLHWNWMVQRFAETLNLRNSEFSLPGNATSFLPPPNFDQAPWVIHTGFEILEYGLTNLAADQSVVGSDTRITTLHILFLLLLFFQVFAMEFIFRKLIKSMEIELREGAHMLAMTPEYIGISQICEKEKKKTFPKSLLILIQ